MFNKMHWVALQCTMAMAGLHHNSVFCQGLKIPKWQSLITFHLQMVGHLFFYLPSAGCSLVINIHFCFGGFFRIFPLVKVRIDHEWLWRKGEYYNGESTWAMSEHFHPWFFLKISLRFFYDIYNITLVRIIQWFIFWWVFFSFLL